MLKRRFLVSLISIVALASCERAQRASSPTPVASAPAAAPAPADDVLARVNGVPIRRADVALKQKSQSHNARMSPEPRESILEAIIREQILSEKAVALGLDADPRYQARLRPLEAQLNAFKRKELAELFLQREASRQAMVTEDEARRHYEEKGARMRTEIHVRQILRRSQASIEEVRRALAAGKPFEEVARSLFPNLPENGHRPWDLGWMKFVLAPPAWQKVVYSMKKGEVSGVLRGPRSRYWIIQLVDRRENAELTFERMKPALIESLKYTKMEELRAKTYKELRAKARVEFPPSR
jgi:peptidyl-prolyl cis-trans isomerase C